ncbi:endonuclease VIII [Congregibacter brevis]|uniref:DNA-(apurinic or apyrimidinic site) lyase n=1 Tax=Congregibacter brevis TaxID=3081201 RepID=A0ABZ0IEV9_9GAMM|nr:endonuclease VIII [Congregibacter sp. IMCC45268]
MPEGPEIRRAADRIAHVLVDEPIEEVLFAFPDLQRFTPVLSGQRVLEVETRGKALLTHFDNDYAIYSHNQLYGVWKIAKRGKMPATNRSLRLALHTSRHSALLYSASDISVWPRDELGMHTFLATLGPDLLSARLEWQDVSERLQSPRFAGRSLAALYLDQHFLAGSGNYLRSEILFCAGLHPKRRPKDLSRGERGLLARETLKLPKRSYETAGITLPPRLAATLKKKVKGFERRRFFVFGRDGRACYQCGDKIRRDSIGSRRIYWCPTCQPES